jgi:hypothetical protein
VARKSKPVLIGGRKPQLREPSERNWTKAKEREFLSALAETCNVTRAADQAGVSLAHAYRNRKADAAFRAGWLEAIGVSYQRLELVLLDRAFNGTEKLVKRRDGSEERMLEYSNQLGLTLLRCTGIRRSRPRPRMSLTISKKSASGCSTSSNG